jgi:putative ATPase
LEVAVLSSVPKAPSGSADAAAQITIDAATAQESIQRKAVSYDASGDEHYDAASALIKSIRGSDPDAAIYWAARMLAAGEDPRFICRRLAILASEDIGNADPRAIMVAQAGWDLVERIGMPEARITIGQLVTYLALCPKSNASYMAIDTAMKDVETGRTQLVPFAIKDKTVKSAAGKSAGTAGGASYQYSHDVATTGAAGQVGGITDQSYLGVSERYYKPVARGHEIDLAARLEAILAERARLRGP